MSEERAEKFLELFNKGKEFTEELLRENQRLRYRVAALETEHGEATTEEIQRLRAEIQQLSEENHTALLVAIKVAFLIFGVLCTAGILASLVRGTVRGQEPEAAETGTA